jgi:hypothetical protein
VAVAGCALGRGPEVQRATQGPTADEVHAARFLGDYGRLPTFDESLAFRSDLEDRVLAYLARHPELSTSPGASQLTFHRRVAVGMDREQVVLLVGSPASVAQDRLAMEAGARQFWPAVQRRATEMWAYPGGWFLYFEGPTLVDITVTGKPPL